MNSPAESKLSGESGVTGTNGQTVNNINSNQGNTNGGCLKSDTSQLNSNVIAAVTSTCRANLIVNYLPQSIKEQDFNMLFSKIGPLKSCKLMFDRQTGYSFGYGFVEYINDEDAKKAIDTLNGYQIEHKRLKVAYARPNCEETKNTNLYIRNIPPNYDEKQLADLFSQYGEVIQVRLLRDQNTSFSRRIGFVIMGTKQMAQMAIAHLDNTVPPDAGNTEPIYVKYADEEGKKRHPPNNMFSNHHHHSALTNLTGGGLGNHHYQQQTHQNIHHQRNQHHHQHPHHRGYTDNNLIHQQHQQSHHNFGGTNHPFGSNPGNNGGGGQFQQPGYQNFGNLGNNQSAVGSATGFGGFMMGNASSNTASNSLSHNLQTLGKMKSNRSSGTSSSRYSYM